MSELINNHQRKRQEALKVLIKQLHQGVNEETIKQAFEHTFGQISTEEIVALEAALVEDGMTIKEIERLCDIHARVMGTSVKALHQAEGHRAVGHPLRVLEDENARIEKVIEDELMPFVRSPFTAHAIMMLRIGFDRLREIDKHYKRKEHLFFPYLEKKGILTPPQVMWGVDDTIRTNLKAVLQILNQPLANEQALEHLMLKTLTEVKEMVFKENNILIPLLQEQLNLLNFIDIAEASDDIGYFLEAPEQSFLLKEKKETVTQVSQDTVHFNTGTLSIKTLEALLNTLPLDMTFVDADGHVRYFSHGKERIFERPKTILGRHVHQCHPPSSVATVETIIERFKSGEKDEEAFWIQMRGKFVHIRYFAVRDNQGLYLGTLEMTQDIAPLRSLESEKRLLEDVS